MTEAVRDAVPAAKDLPVSSTEPVMSTVADAVEAVSAAEASRPPRRGIFKWFNSGQPAPAQEAAELDAVLEPEAFYICPKFLWFGSKPAEEEPDSDHEPDAGSGEEEEVSRAPDTEGVSEAAPVTARPRGFGFMGRRWGAKKAEEKAAEATDAPKPKKLGYWRRSARPSSAVPGPVVIGPTVEAAVETPVVDAPVDDVPAVDPVSEEDPEAVSGPVAAPKPRMLPAWMSFGSKKATDKESTKEETKVVPEEAADGAEETAGKAARETAALEAADADPVSYTHLTLPTILLV